MFLHLRESYDGLRSLLAGMRITLRQHFDDDLFFGPRAQHRVDRRQMLVEPYIHDAAAHRDDRAEVWNAGLTAHNFAF